MFTAKPFITRAAVLLGCATIVFLAAGTEAPEGVPLPDPLADEDFLFDGAPSPALVDLGRDLFFDPILSGNRNISCGTCHDPSLGTSDGLPLGIGEGGAGAGAERRTSDAVTGRVPRNSPALWNIGAREYRVMFHDGRLEDLGNDALNLRVPSVAPLPDGLDSVLAAQAFFPVTSAIEMAGQRGENEVADAMLTQGFNAAWAEIAQRVAATDEYAAAFIAAYADVESADDIQYAQIAQALAAFQTVAFRTDDSAFDQVLASGDTSHLSAKAADGLELFYGKAGCASCHSGPLLTDHAFHAIAVPQIGPGKGHGRDAGYWEMSGMMAFLEDEGRYRVTGDPDDLFAFRTPSLRNVAVTGPWGHSGAFDALEAMVRHHLNAVQSLEDFDPGQIELPQLDRIIDQTGGQSASGYTELDSTRRAVFLQRDGFVQASPRLRGRIAAANDLQPLNLSDAEVSNLLAFLESLTDPKVATLSSIVPTSVPSGLQPQPQPAGSLSQTKTSEPVLNLP
ncbi:cytochrome c peroxidase [Yoonia sp. SS1-5]|uniref:Cytochrome-c peroxidase n=1 Tax=Yoonia rhodophyticola TaxID=3137370 RepID=A0AAN0NI11_9RHOB